MQSYIQQYLSDFYYIKTSEVGNDGIYSINDNRRIPTPFNGSKLITEIVTIFCVNEDDVKTYIESWAISIKQDVDLEFYWKTMEDFILPIAQQIAATTIGLDIVSVQPMSAPRGELLYMDFRYDNNE